ncbi:MAG: hypothetical protein GF346_11200 [Candidatus Eisenbacteria bacterium]|nr:hypothetical protein [Candidatus Latescibacterota bacterium]MBD3303001.1 hypothetical protein [Candidatus Eisenbacteria bacterium]
MIWRHSRSSQRREATEVETKKLQIGDQDNAILIIQATQSDPQKALAELVENSIDARARRITILRRKRRDEIEIEITDDGEGVRAGPDGSSDMERVATSICKSFKRELEEHLRGGIQGEFAIGLLGFAAIGRHLEMRSRTETSTSTSLLRLSAESNEYEVETCRKHLPRAGTVVRIWPVHKNIASRLTAEKLRRYLGEELRERIIEGQVRITVEDRVGRRRQLEVKPHKYQGTRISTVTKAATSEGNITFRLFVAERDSMGRVAIYRRGTKVLDDVTEISELDHEPWTNPILEGMIDSRFISVPPGTRRGIVPDASLGELVAAIRTVEGLVGEAVREAEQQREKRLGTEIVKRLRDAFSDLMKELPEEYSWFNGRRGGGVPGRPASEGGPGKRRQVLLALGPLDHVTVTPKVSQIAPSERKTFLAKSWTPDRKMIPVDVDYQWVVDPPEAADLEANGAECVLSAGPEEGEVRLSVRASLREKSVQAVVVVLILRETRKARQQAFPTPIPVHRPGERWRSRWNAATDSLEYNTGHEDYLAAKKGPKKAYLRYLGLLFAKHLVLHNFKESGEEPVLERMIEVVARLESKI